MGTVLEIHGVKIRVIPGDHLPMHVHCEGTGAEIRYNLETQDWMDGETAFSKSALRHIEEQIKLNLQDLIDEWRRCNG